MSVFYKVLDTDGRAFIGGKGSWPLPTDDGPGGWLTVEGEIVPCKNGLHLCRRRDLVRWLGPAIFLAEADGPVVEQDDKVVVARARLVRRLDTWNERTARLFAADCAERVLHLIPEGRRGPFVEAVRVARLFAAGEASDAERRAAWDAAGPAALDAAWAAAGAAAWGAALDAAWAAAGGAARDAAWDAARDAAWDAAGAAAWGAAGDAERAWQTDRLFHYLDGESGR